VEETRQQETDGGEYQPWARPKLPEKKKARRGLREWRWLTRHGQRDQAARGCCDRSGLTWERDVGAPGRMELRGKAYKKPGGGWPVPKKGKGGKEDIARQDARRNGRNTYRTRIKRGLRGSIA